MRNIPSSARRGFLLGILAVFVVATVIHVPETMAQFGIKLPKLPAAVKDSKDNSKDNSKTAAANKPKAPAPEVSNIQPNVVPPGWEGDVVFTGKNFLTTMTVMMNCPGYPGLKTRDSRVDNSGSATLKLQVPAPNSSAENEEATCKITLQQTLADIQPSAQGTPVVTQVTGLSFAISDSSPLARSYQACFVVEGDLSPEEFAEKFAVWIQKSPEECKLWVSASSVKYSVGEKTILDAQASGVKAIEPIDMFGQPFGFRLSLTNGKIYSFTDGRQVREKIKRKLKK